MSDPVPLPILSAPIAVSSTIPESPCIKILDFLGVQDFIDPNIYGFRHTSETQYLLYRSQATNHTLQIWDMNSFELVSVVDAQILPTRVRSWTLTNDRNALVIAFCSIDTCTIKWYDLHSRKFVRTLELPGNNKEYEIEESMLITYDGRKLIRVFDSEIRIFDLRTGIMLRSTAAHDLAKGYFTEIVGSYPNLDRHEILTYATNEVAAVWRASDDSFELVTGPFRLGVHSISGRTSIRFTGDRIIYENPDGGLTIGYFENGQFQVEVQHSSPQAQFPRNYSLSSDCQMFAVRYPGSGTMFVIRNAYSGNIIAGPLPYDDEIWQWGFSPDGKHFTTSSRSRIRVWDVEAAIEQYRIANAPLANSSLPKEKETLNFRSTGQFQHDGPRRRSSSSDHSLLSLPATSEPERSTAPPADNVVASEVLSIFYGRQRERRNQIDFDSLLDLPATDAPVRPRAQELSSAARKISPDPPNTDNPPEPVVETPRAVHNRTRTRLAAFWARMRRRGTSDHAPERNTILLRDISAPPVPAPPTDEIVEVAAGRLDERLVIAPGKKKKKILPAPLPGEEPTPESDGSSSSPSVSSDSDAESIDWLDYICFCMCLPSNKSKKKKKEERRS